MEEQIVIRPEGRQDYSAAEELTRDAFWNRYQPGCTEHCILHRIRSRPEYMPELSCVLEADGEMVGHILYVRTDLERDGGEKLPVLLFGPVSVRPDRQGRGYGSRLISETLQMAADAGHGAVVITGDPGYYSRFGFRPGSSLGIRYGDAAGPMPYFMALELIPGYLRGFSGTYRDPPGYLVSEAEAEAFDRRFPPREKLVLPGQLKK